MYQHACIVKHPAFCINNKAPTVFPEGEASCVLAFVCIALRLRPMITALVIQPEVRRWDEDIRSLEADKPAILDDIENTLFVFIQSRLLLRKKWPMDRNEHRDKLPFLILTPRSA